MTLDQADGINDQSQVQIASSEAAYFVVSSMTRRLQTLLTFAGLSARLEPTDTLSRRELIDDGGLMVGTPLTPPAAIRFARSAPRASPPAREECMKKSTAVVVVGLLAIGGVNNRLWWSINFAAE